MAPAFYLDKDALRIIKKADLDGSFFAPVQKPGTKSLEWSLVLADGNEGFTAQLQESAVIGTDGGRLSLRFNGVTEGELASNQISAVLADTNGTVLAYGKVAEADAGQTQVEIPSGLGLKNGLTYTLYLFSERTGGKNETGYASNMASIPLKIGTAAQVKEEYTRTVKLTASSAAQSSKAAYAYDGDEETAWKPQDEDKNPSLTMTFNRKVAIDHFRLSGSVGSAEGFTVEMGTGTTWKEVYTSDKAPEDGKDIYIHGSELCEGTAFRLTFSNAGGDFGISEIALHAFQNQAIEDKGTMIEVTKTEPTEGQPEGEFGKDYDISCLIDGNRIPKERKDAWSGAPYNGNYPAQATITFTYPVQIDEVNILAIQEAMVNPDAVWEWLPGAKPEIPDDKLLSKLVEHNYTVSYYNEDRGEWEEFGRCDTSDAEKKNVLTVIKADEPVFASALRVEVDTWYWIMLAEIEPVKTLDIPHVNPEQAEMYALTVEGGEIVSAGGKAIGKKTADIPAGEEVIIRAEDEDAFKEWEILLASEGFRLRDKTSVRTDFIMPEGAVKVKASADPTTPLNLSAVFKADPEGWAYAEKKDLDALLDDSDIIGSDDEAFINQGGTVEVTMLAVRKDSNYSGAGSQELKEIIDQDQEKIAFYAENSLSKKRKNKGNTTTAALATASNAIPVVMTLPKEVQNLKNEDYRLLSYRDKLWQEEDFRWETEGTAMEAKERVNGLYAVVAARYYTVTYKDWDGKVLKEDKVRYGENSTPPPVPERSGYLFSKWSRDYQNITENITVTAKYKKAESSKGVIETLRNILEILEETEGRPIDVESDVSYQISRIQKIDFTGFYDKEEVWELLEEIENRVAELTGTDVPEAENTSESIHNASVTGALFSLPVSEGGTVLITDASVPSAAGSLTNTAAFQVKLEDSQGRECAFKTMLLLEADLPDGIDPDKEIAAMDGSGKECVCWLEGNRIFIVVGKAGIIAVGNKEESSGSSGGSSGSSGRRSRSSRDTSGISGGSVSGQWEQSHAGNGKSWRFKREDGTYVAGHTVTDAMGRVLEQVAWAKINGAWYAFGADGYADSGWILDVAAGTWYYVDIESGMKTGWNGDPHDGQIYYLNPSDGRMVTEWQKIEDRWYYFNPFSAAPTWKRNEESGDWEFTGSKERPFGAMYRKEETPDGYFVGEDGAWDGREKKQDAETGR